MAVPPLRQAELRAGKSAIMAACLCPLTMLSGRTAAQPPTPPPGGGTTWARRAGA
jgi:hypothetical protein